MHYEYFVGRHCGEARESAGHCGPRDVYYRQGFGGRWGGRMHGFGGRMFEGGALRLLILDMIAAKPQHGYELIKAIEEQFGGAYSPSPGVVYPTLSMLEDQGLIAVESAEGNRKQYSITDAGRAELKANQSVVDAVKERVAEAGKTGRRGRSPQVVRAMENVRMALRLKLSQGTVSAEQVKKIAAALDAAAKQIEEL